MEAVQSRQKSRWHRIRCVACTCMSALFFAVLHLGLGLTRTSLISQIESALRSSAFPLSCLRDGMVMLRSTA
eukprot:2248083-Rhodomonas_salina.3